jgi:YVTN family beta-propeller protein
VAAKSKKVRTQSTTSQKLYVSYGQGNKIGAVDLATGTVTQLAGHLMDNYVEGTGTSARFSDVAGMVLSPDGGTLYLSDRNNHRIRTLNTTTGESKYLTGAGLTNLIDPNNPTGIIDVNLKNGFQEGGPCPDTFSRGVAGCAYFNRPTGLALTKDGKTLYVANSESGTISLVDAVTRSVVGLISLPDIQHGPFGLAMTPDDTKLYATDIVGDLLYIVDLPNRAVVTTLPVVSY